MTPVSSRIRAFLWHLSASATLAVLALSLVFWIWYPAPLHKAMGVTDIFLLLLAVDVILGPCLTLAVAKPGKKRHLLLLDLTVIITVQIAAFLYGLNAVAAGRPAWVVLSEGQFNVISPVEIDQRYPDLADQIAQEYRQPPLTGPQWISAPQPEDTDVATGIQTEISLALASLSGFEIYHQPKYYRPLQEGFSIIQENAQPLDNLKKFNPEADVQEKLAAYPDADAFLPLKGKVRSMTVLLKKSENRIIATVDLRPWME
ncbi:MAG: hypothetical protein LBU53_12285 [Zoogloeaceae bacterium]|jgi:hypothetical protein|nr:hypothetical protein [Zoogloeaceae bacterium]